MWPVGCAHRLDALDGAVSGASNRGSRLEILAHARFLLIPVLGLLALVVFPLGFIVGLIYPPWGHAIWDSLDDVAEWYGLLG